MALFILLGFLKSLVFRAEKAIKSKTKKQPAPGIDWVLPNEKTEGRKQSMKGAGCFLFLQQMTGAFLQFCQAKKLRPKTMNSYEQTLKLFARWLEEEKGIETVEAITEEIIIAYIVELQQRGKYTCYVSDAAKATNYPMRRRDYRQAVSNTTINNYMRNMKVFFTWLVDSEYILQSPMRRIHALPQERKPKEYLDLCDYAFSQLHNESSIRQVWQTVGYPFCG